MNRLEPVQLAPGMVLRLIRIGRSLRRLAAITASVLIFGGSSEEELAGWKSDHPSFDIRLADWKE
jgi:hypothetical protein